MEILIVLLLIGSLLGLLDVAADRFGAESRESFVDPRSRAARSVR